MKKMKEQVFMFYQPVELLLTLFPEFYAIKSKDKLWNEIDKYKVRWSWTTDLPALAESQGVCDTT